MDTMLALSTPAWAGLSALGGALVGGIVAGGATYVVERGRQNFERSEHERDRSREDDSRQAVVRGIARVLLGRTGDERSSWSTALDHGVWPPAIFERTEPLPEADQQLLAANLSSYEWEVMVATQLRLSGLRALHDHVADAATAEADAGVVRTPSGEVRLPLSDMAREMVRELIEALDLLGGALERLASE